MADPKTGSTEPEPEEGTRESRDRDPQVDERAPTPEREPKAADRRRGLRKRLSVAVGAAGGDGLARSAARGSKASGTLQRPTGVERGTVKSALC